MFSVGDRVGDYEIVARLKAGGMATLFLGKRTGAAGFSRHVAIKVVHEHLAADSTFVQMFVDEALLSSKIHHPNVVHVEELRQVDGRHFLVMEYVHGCALSALMKGLRRAGRTFGHELATYIAVKVAEGLHAAHQATASDGSPLSVVHRDVSPQNVLLAYKGHVKLIDFGVAKAAGRAVQTTGGSLKGKIRYMSPEQAFGKPVDRRTDVYALGIVLWEMLTARRAFVGDNDFAILEQVRDPKVPPARTHNPDVPEALDSAIQKALAKSPEDRFQSAQEMRKALARAVPSALALDDSDLAGLLATVLGDAIRGDQEALPESVSGVGAAVAEPDEDALQTLTVSAAGLELLSAPDIQSVPEAEVIRATPPADEVESPTRAATPRAVRAEPRDSVGSPSRMPIAMGVALLFLGLGATGAVVGWRYLSAEPTEIQVTELPSTSREPTEVATPPEAVQVVEETTAVIEVPPEAPVEEPPAETTPEEAPAEAAEPPAEVTRPTKTTRPTRRRRAPRRRTTPAARSRRGGVFLTDDF